MRRRATSLPRRQTSRPRSISRSRAWVSSACCDSVPAILAASIGRSGDLPSTICRATGSARSSPLGMSMPNSASRPRIMLIICVRCFTKHYNHGAILFEGDQRTAQVINPGHPPPSVPHTTTVPDLCRRPHSFWTRGRRLSASTLIWINDAHALFIETNKLGPSELVLAPNGPHRIWHHEKMALAVHNCGAAFTVRSIQPIQPGWPRPDGGAALYVPR